MVMFQLKLRDQVNIEQEKLLGEKSREMEEMRKDLEEVKSLVRSKEEEVIDGRRSCDSNVTVH